MKNAKNLYVYWIWGVLFSWLLDLLIFKTKFQMHQTNFRTAACSGTSLHLKKCMVSFTAWKVSLFGVFLVLNFQHLDWILREIRWIRRDTPYLSKFSSNAGSYGPEKLQIRTLFTYCTLHVTAILPSDVLFTMQNYLLVIISSKTIDVIPRLV